jgi:hypothetical protein
MVNKQMEWEQDVRKEEVEGERVERDSDVDDEDDDVDDGDDAIDADLDADMSWATSTYLCSFCNLRRRDDIVAVVVDVVSCVGIGDEEGEYEGEGEWGGDCCRRERSGGIVDASGHDVGEYEGEEDGEQEREDDDNDVDGMERGRGTGTNCCAVCMVGTELASSTRVHVCVVAISCVFIQIVLFSWGWGVEEDGGLMRVVVTEEETEGGEGDRIGV